MDLQRIVKGLDYAQRRKKWVLFVAALLSFTGYGAYRVYHLPFVIQKRKRVIKFLGSLISIAEMASESAEVIGIVSKDFRQFLQSDSDKIPNSLRQISKVAQSDEFSESLVRLTRSLTFGVMRGYQSKWRTGDPVMNGSGLTEMVLDKLFTAAGSGFASVVVGSFARNLAMAFYLDRNCSSKDSMDGFLVDSPQWVDALFSDKCRELIGDCIQLFVTTAVAVYLDKTMHINTYDEIFAGLTNPKHEARVKEMLTSVSKGTVESLVRTSHQVLVSADSMVHMNPMPNGHAIRTNQQIGREGNFQNGRVPNLENRNSGLGAHVSSFLAVPSNMRLVLDVTGTVTFETVRTFLEFLVDKIYVGLRSSVSVIQEEVVDKGVEAVKFVTARTSNVVTVCLSLCLHILGSPWLLVPA